MMFLNPDLCVNTLIGMQFEDGFYKSQIVSSLGWVGLGLRSIRISICPLGSSHFLGARVTFKDFLFFKVLMKIVSFGCFMGNFVFFYAIRRVLFFCR